MKRTLAVFLGAAGAILALAILKALLISGLRTLPPVKVLVFASSAFGLIAALLDWAIFKDLFAGGKIKPERPTGAADRLQNAVANTPRRAGPPHRAPVLERALLRPIVFREICPPPPTGFSFYGGAPVGPAQLAWPRVRNKPGDAPLSFIIQWDCTELCGQDATGLLPRHGVLYLFADLNWGEPFDFQFIHAQGPVHDWQALPLPPGLPAIYGADGAYQVPYCSPRVAKERQDVPRLLPKWPFTPLAFLYPVSRESDAGAIFWSDGEAVAEALLHLHYPEGIPPASRLDRQQPPFVRPFPAFPHDHAAVRVVAAKVLAELRSTGNLLRDLGAPDREAKFAAWRDEAVQLYESAATHPPQARLEQSRSDDIWRWMAGLEPVLRLGWRSLVDECVNVSLGLGSEAAPALPAELVAACADQHRLARAYLHDEHPDHRNPQAMAEWKARKEQGSLAEVRSLHAPCPNHMFGPPSFVQGHVEEFLDEWILLLELSTRHPIGLEFGEGVLQFLIRRSDLEQGRFDKAKLVASAY